MSDEVKRMRYFNGLFLTEDEFNLEQNYNIRMRSLHNRRLHSWGIVWGLDVIAGPGNKEITIKEGMALNKVTIGGEEVTQEIILTEDAPVDLSDYDNDAEVYIYIYYYEDGADVEPNKGEQEKIHWLEKPQIGHSTTEPADKNKNIILSKVVIKDKIAPDNIIYEKEPGISLRTYAGAYGKLILPIEKEISSLPSIEGKKIGDQNGIQINSTIANFTGALTIKEGIKGGLHIGGTSDPGDENLEVDGNCSVNGKLSINGNAGIGTSSPNHKLEVAKDINNIDGDGQIVASGETNTNKGLALGFDTLNDVGFIYAREKNVGPRNIVLGYPDGNIGIGTLNPSEKLEINGNVKAGVYYGDGSQLTGTGKWSDATAPAGSIYYDKGNVGIGTKNPATILHISNASSTPIVKIEGMLNKAGEGAKLRWTEFYQTDWGIEAFYESAKDLLIFRSIEDNNVKLDNILVIDRKAGRVGIGTSAPNHKLEVTKDIGSVGDDGQIVASGETNTNKGLVLGFDTLNNVGFIYAREKTVGSRNLVLGYPDGKVGIGTLNPSEKLEINGNVKAGLFIGDGSQLTGISAGKWSDAIAPAPAGSIYYDKGNVGIGTKSPISLLQVGESDYIQFNRWTYYPLNFGFSGADRARIRVQNETWGPKAGQNFMQLIMVDSGGNGVDNLNLFSDGSVGIGATPTEKLEVDGNVKAKAFIGDGSQLTGISASKWSDAIAPAPAGSIYYDKGNVGIGTKNPATILHISNANSTPIVKIEGMLNKAGEGAKLRWTEFYQTDWGIEAFYESAKDLLIFRNIEDNNVKLDNILVIDRKAGRVGIGTAAPSTSLDVVGDIKFTGNLIGGGKGGYVMDQFVNKVGETLEQGDIVVIGENQSSLYYGPDSNIPILEIDLAQRAYDTRTCGIVCEVYTELMTESEEESPSGKAKKPKETKVAKRKVKPGNVHQQAFTPEELANLDRTKIESGQIGWMVTLGAYAHCKVDADIAPIEIGDLLTTSSTKGHAQKVIEPEKAIGAVIGKALGSLREGKGKIPVLVTLH